MLRENQFQQSNPYEAKLVIKRADKQKVVNTFYPLPDTHAPCVRHDVVKQLADKLLVNLNES